MGENLNYEAEDSKCYGEGARVYEYDNKKHFTLSKAKTQANCDKYGRLYPYGKAKRSCPEGWHLPTEKEWDVLFYYAGYADKSLEIKYGWYNNSWHLSTEKEWDVLFKYYYDYASEKTGELLKAKYGWNDYKDKSGNGTDLLGFEALPGGLGSIEFGVLPDGSGSRPYFKYMGYIGAWWRADGDGNNSYGLRLMHNNSKSVEVEDDRVYTKLASIRCVQGFKEAPRKEEETCISVPHKWQTGAFTDTRDGKIYKTIKIDGKTWLAENLNYKAEGSKCYGEDGKAYFDYDYTALPFFEIEANCFKYGRLYSYEMAKKSCPKGWHLPNNEDWYELGIRLDRGTELKATCGWGQNGNGTDYYGFSALPGGRGSKGRFNDIGENGYWWSIGYKKTGEVKYLSQNRKTMDDYDIYPYRGVNQNDLYSVRCLRD